MKVKATLGENPSELYWKQAYYMKKQKRLGAKKLDDTFQDALKKTKKPSRKRKKRGATSFVKKTLDKLF